MAAPKPRKGTLGRIFAARFLLSFTATISLFATPIVAWTVRDEELIKYAFEQSFNRQTNENRSVPLLMNSGAFRLCVVGATAVQSGVVSRFRDLFVELTGNTLTFRRSEKLSECPSETRQYIYLTQLPLGEAVADATRDLAGIGIDMGPRHLTGRLEDGIVTVFLLNDDGQLYSLSVVADVESDTLQRALVLRSLVQVTTTAQPVEWVGSFFSINQVVRKTAHPSKFELLPGPGEKEPLLDKDANAEGLCWADTALLSFVFTELEEIESFETAMAKLVNSSAALIQHYRALRVSDRYSDIMDPRCSGLQD